jgi:hypothetical protein
VVHNPGSINELQKSDCTSVHGKHPESGPACTALGWLLCASSRTPDPLLYLPPVLLLWPWRLLTCTPCPFPTPPALPRSTMNKDSSVCGEPACDGMSVTVQGDILRATSVAFEGRGVTPIRSGAAAAGCLTSRLSTNISKVAHNLNQQTTSDTTVSWPAAS